MEYKKEVIKCLPYQDLCNIYYNRFRAHAFNRPNTTFTPYGLSEIKNWYQGSVVNFCQNMFGDIANNPESIEFRKNESVEIWYKLMVSSILREDRYLVFSVTKDNIIFGSPIQFRVTLTSNPNKIEKVGEIEGISLPELQSYENNPRCYKYSYLEFQSADKPLEKQTFDKPLDAQTVDKPLDVQTVDKPLDVQTVDELMGLSIFDEYSEPEAVNESIMEPLLSFITSENDDGDENNDAQYGSTREVQSIEDAINVLRNQINDLNDEFSKKDTKMLTLDNKIFREKINQTNIRINSLYRNIKALKANYQFLINKEKNLQDQIKFINLTISSIFQDIDAIKNNIKN